MNTIDAIIIALVLTVGYDATAHADIELGPPVFDDEWDLSIDDFIDNPIPPPGPELCVDGYTGNVVTCNELEFGLIEV